MLQSQLTNKITPILLILNCFLLISASLTGTAWCFDIEKNQDTESAIVPYECHFNVNPCETTPADILTQRSQPAQDECQMCIDYTFEDITPIRLIDRQGDFDISGGILATYQPHPKGYRPLTFNEVKHFQQIYLPALSSEKSLKATVLII